MICLKVNPTNGQLLIASNTNGRTDRAKVGPSMQTFFFTWSRETEETMYPR